MPFRRILKFCHFGVKLGGFELADAEDAQCLYHTPLSF
jgi:hypothetical protein